MSASKNKAFWLSHGCWYSAANLTILYIAVWYSAANLTVLYIAVWKCNIMTTSSNRPAIWGQGCAGREPATNGCSDRPLETGVSVYSKICLNHSHTSTSQTPDEHLLSVDLYLQNPFCVYACLFSMLAEAFQKWNLLIIEEGGKYVYLIRPQRTKSGRLN